MDTRPRISRVIITGDSLTDRGEMEVTTLCGLEVMGFFSGLSGVSPQGSFSNGYVWPDLFSSHLANQVTERLIQHNLKLDKIGISEAILTGNKQIAGMIDDAYTLNDHERVAYQGVDMVEVYARGGMSAANFQNKWSFNPATIFKRKLLPSLDEMRARIFKSDSDKHISLELKQETAVLDWTGINDLITLNSTPTRALADQALASRIENVIEMMKMGYAHFMLFNIPDVSLTPRYQAKSEKVRRNLNDVCAYFNMRLAEELTELQRLYPSSTFTLFDVQSPSADMYHNPAKYGFDPAKRDMIYIKSKEFKMLKNGTSPSTGCISYDGLHPTADVQALLNEFLIRAFHQAYLFSPERIMSAVVTQTAAAAAVTVTSAAAVAEGVVAAVKHEEEFQQIRPSRTW